MFAMFQRRCSEFTIRINGKTNHFVSQYSGYNNRDLEVQRSLEHLKRKLFSFKSHLSVQQTLFHDEKECCKFQLSWEKRHLSLGDYRNRFLLEHTPRLGENVSYNLLHLQRTVHLLNVFFTAFLCLCHYNLCQGTTATQSQLNIFNPLITTSPYFELFQR